MDQLPQHGKAIAQIVRPTHEIYGSLLQQNAAAIKSTPRKTFSYGADPRQNLDVYYPSSIPTGAECPIMVFLYGGGLVNGAKILPMVDNELVYANIGHFFADKCGFVVVIPDYRLVPQARFPSGGEDLSLTVDWINSHLDILGSGAETKNLFIMGNSAGGVHLSTYLFSPTFTAARRKVLAQDGESSLRLKGAIFLSVPFHFEAAEPARHEILTSYYGDRVSEDCPFGLLRALEQAGSIEDVLPSVKYLSLTGTLDPEDEILLPNRDFTNLWTASESLDTKTLQVKVMEGHNHISPPFALATGDPKEENWGFEVADFCASTLS